MYNKDQKTPPKLPSTNETSQPDNYNFIQKKCYDYHNAIKNNEWDKVKKYKDILDTKDINCNNYLNFSEDLIKDMCKLYKDAKKRNDTPVILLLKNILEQANIRCD